MKSGYRRLVWDHARRKLRPIPAGAAGEGGSGSGEGGEGGNPSGGGGSGSGGEGGSGGSGGSGEGGTGEGGQGGDVQTLTQSQLSAMLTREKNQGRAAAERQVSEDLGMSLDEAKELLQAARDREEAEKSDAQKAKDAADREKQEAERAKADAARERYDARVERALIRAGISPGSDEADKLNRVARMVTAEVDADAETIQAEVDTLKSDFPELFGATGEGEGEGHKPPPSSDPNARPPKPKTKDGAFDRGAERAKQFRQGGVTFESRRQENVNT